MSFFKNKPWRSPAYLDHVRSYSCAACNAPPPSDPHHWREHHAGTGTKVGDQYTAPLCRQCHRQWHDRRELAGLDTTRSQVVQLIAQRDCMADWIANEG